MTMTTMQRGHRLVEALHNPQAYEQPVATVFPAHFFSAS